jgi:hypothetical protein
MYAYRCMSYIGFCVFMMEIEMEREICLKKMITITSCSTLWVGADMVHLRSITTHAIKRNDAFCVYEKLN